MIMPVRVSGYMESSEVRARSLITSVALFGVGTVIGATATWLIMSAIGSDRGGSSSLRSPPSTTSTVPEDGGDGRIRTLRQQCTDQLRSFLADLEVRLMDAVDDLVAHFSASVRNGGQTTKPSSRRPSPTDVKCSKSQYVCFLLLLDRGYM